MTGVLPSSCSIEAVVLVKAAPQTGQKHGETVCCAGLDLHGNWLRLYPVSFRYLEHSQKFGRWDRITFRCRKPNDDGRPESRRVEKESITIKGELKKSERERFLAKSVVTSLTRERQRGRSLALLKPEIIRFEIEKKDVSKIEEERQRFEKIRSQSDLFSKQVTPYQPCPYQFRYTYRIEDGQRCGTCQDWEMEATFFNWSRKYGEEKALSMMEEVFGSEYPKKGMLLAMGTHSRYPETWLINGIIRLDEIRQLSLI